MLTSKQSESNLTQQCLNYKYTLGTTGRFLKGALRILLFKPTLFCPELSLKTSLVFLLRALLHSYTLQQETAYKHVLWKLLSPGYIAGSHTHEGQLHDSPANVVRQGPPIHKHAPQLVHARLPWVIEYTGAVQYSTFLYCNSISCPPTEEAVFLDVAMVAMAPKRASKRQTPYF